MNYAGPHDKEGANASGIWANAILALGQMLRPNNWNVKRFTEAASAFGEFIGSHKRYLTPSDSAYIAMRWHASPSFMRAVLACYNLARKKPKPKRAVLRPLRRTYGKVALDYAFRNFVSRQANAGGSICSRHWTLVQLASLQVQATMKPPLYNGYVSSVFTIDKNRAWVAEIFDPMLLSFE